MKKILILLMALMMCFGFAGCGSDKDDDGTKDIADENAQEMENDAEQDKDKIERSVDAVAAELGLTGGTETLYDIIRQIAGVRNMEQSGIVGKKQEEKTCQE